MYIFYFVVVLSGASRELVRFVEGINMAVISNLA